MHIFTIKYTTEDNVITITLKHVLNKRTFIANKNCYQLTNSTSVSHDILEASWNSGMR